MPQTSPDIIINYAPAYSAILGASIVALLFILFLPEYSSPTVSLHQDYISLREKIEKDNMLFASQLNTIITYVKND